MVQLSFHTGHTKWLTGSPAASVRFQPWMLAVPNFFRWSGCSAGCKEQILTSRQESAESWHIYSESWNDLMNLSFFKSRPFLFCDWRQCYTCHHQVSMPTAQQHRWQSFWFPWCCNQFVWCPKCRHIPCEGSVPEFPLKNCIEWFFAKALQISKSSLFARCNCHLPFLILWTGLRENMSFRVPSKTLNRGSSAFCGKYVVLVLLLGFLSSAFGTVIPRSFRPGDLAASIPVQGGRGSRFPCRGQTAKLLHSLMFLVVRCVISMFLVSFCSFWYGMPCWYSKLVNHVFWYSLQTD